MVQQYLCRLRPAWYSIAVNAVLVAVNLSVATASASLAVGAEVVHNGVDLLSALGVLVGIKLAVHKSRRFPYGLYKLENVISVVGAGLVFITAYEIGRRAIFGASRQTSASWWMFAVLLVAAVIPAIFSHFELRAGQAAKSPAFIADAREYQVHVLTTAVALAALEHLSCHEPVRDGLFLFTAGSNTRRDRQNVEHSRHSVARWSFGVGTRGCRSWPTTVRRFAAPCDPGWHQTC